MQQLSTALILTNKLALSGEQNLTLMKLDLRTNGAPSNDETPNDWIYEPTASNFDHEGCEKPNLLQTKVSITSRPRPGGRSWVETNNQTKAQVDKIGNALSR